MSRLSTAITPRIISALGMALLCLILGNATASAQFSWLYGGGANDGARGGLVTLGVGAPGGAGFITCGEALSFGPTNDVYVVRTNFVGAIVWSAVYDLGGNDFSRKIRATADGGFIITGYTDNNNNCCLRDDIFLLKIDANGAVVWAKTYGGIDYDEGRDVQEMRDSSLVVAARTRSYGFGDEDGVLIRTTSTGNLIWAKVYGGELLDIFLSCTITMDNNIVAAGGSASFSANGDADIWMLKVNSINGNLIWSNTYPGPVAATDFAWAVIELRVMAPGMLLLACNTRSYGGNAEGLLLQTQPTGAFFTSHLIGGAQGGGWDELLDVQEVPPTYDGSVAGHVVATGLMFDVPGGFGNYDLYIGEFVPIGGLPTLWQSVHGGQGVDQGWDVDVAPIPTANYFSVVSAGVTDFTSFPTAGFGLDDLYLVNAARFTGNSRCAFRMPQTRDTTPIINHNPVNHCVAMVKFECDVEPLPISVVNGRDICATGVPGIHRSPESDEVMRLRQPIDSFNVRRAPDTDVSKPRVLK